MVFDIYLNDMNVVFVTEGLEKDGLDMVGSIPMRALGHDAEKHTVRVSFQNLDGGQKSTRETFVGLCPSYDSKHSLAHSFPVHR